MMNVKDRIRTILLLEEMQKNKVMAKNPGFIDKSKFGGEDYKNNSSKRSYKMISI